MRFKIVESMEEIDSEGNVLSPEQIKFFKNSKVRDRSGRLLVCYHGSASKFDEFNPQFIGRDNKMGIGFYFTRGKKLEYDYPATYRCYINIVSPAYESTEMFNDILEYEESMLERGWSNKQILDGVRESFNVDGIIGDERGHNAICAYFPNQIKSITNKNPSNSNNINENIGESAITVYRVGQVNDFSNGLFFTDSLSYYDHSMTGYKKQDAIAYKLDLGKAKAIDIVSDWNLSVNTWSDIRQTEEFFDSKDFPYYEYLESVDYDDENAYHEVMTDTDSLAQWAHDNGYDVCIIRDVYDNYGKRFTEYCVYNKDLIKPLNTNSSRGRAPMTESTSPASIDEQTFKDAFSEPMNTLYGSKDMGMDVVCERLYYDYGIDATYHGATIYVGDDKLCTLRFSHEGRNLWGIYEIRTYMDGLKKVYTVQDFFE